MSKPANPLYQFGPFHLDPVSRLLLRQGEPVPLMPKAFEMLLVLVENSGRVMEKAELMNALWPDSFVEEANLTVNVSALRKALGESPNQHRYIVTVPGRGYKFVAGVRQAGAEAAELSGEEAEKNYVAIDDEDATPAPERKNPVAAPAGAPANRAQKSRRVSSLIWLAVSLLAIALVMVSFSLWRLRRPEATGGKAVIRSIAVLPFKPLVADNRDESLEMGIADTLIFRLSSIRGTVVRLISAVRKYTELNQDPLPPAESSRWTPSSTEASRKWVTGFG